MRSCRWPARVSCVRHGPCGTVRGMSVVIAGQGSWSWRLTASHAAGASLLLLVLRLAVMAAPLHMASDPPVLSPGDVSIMAGLPPACLLGTGDCSVTATPPSDLTPTSAWIDVGVSVPSRGTVPQLVEAASHGPPRAERPFALAWA